MSLEDKVDGLIRTLGDVQKDVHSVKNDCYTIKRGMYGDKENLVIGLMQRQMQDELEIKKLQDKWKKVVWMVAGFVVAIEVVSLLIKFYDK